MTDREAQEIVRMVESNWRFDLGKDARKMWRDEMYGYPAELGTAAVARLAKTQRTPPALSDLLSMMRHMMSDREASRPELPRAAPAAEDSPEWVDVWYWCRSARNPRLLLPFPQQEGHVDSTEMISMERYEELRQEWVAAGSPRHKNRLPSMEAA